MKTELARLVLGAGLCLAASGCTSDAPASHAARNAGGSHPTAPAATSVAPSAGAGSPGAADSTACAVTADYSGQHMLQVRDVRPKTSSVVFGYQETRFNPQSCVMTEDLSTIAPNCSRHFPWVVGDQDRTNRFLYAAGVRTVWRGLVRGHRPVPDDEVAKVQEVRETILRADSEAAPKAILSFAETCAKPYRLAGATAYRTTTYSLDTGGQIAAFLIADRGRLLWLEFDDGYWHDDNYPPVLQKALDRAR
jgi:hypothetical protein